MRRTTLAFALALSLSSGSATAQDSTALEQARTFFKIGAKAYKQGKFLDAAKAFEQAYQRAQRPGLLFSLAQAHRKQFFTDNDPQRLNDAIVYYRQYLDKDPQGNRRAEAASELSKLVPIQERLAPKPAPPAAPCPEGEDCPEPNSPPNPAPAAARPSKNEGPSLMISSPTPGVRIEFDGKPVEGSTLITSEVKPGKHTLRLSAPGYKPYTREIQFDATRGAPPLDIELEALPARIVIQAPEGASITVDGRLQGVAPMPALTLTEGEHFVAVTQNGHQPFTKTLRVKKGQRLSVNAELESTGQRTTSWWLMGVGAAGLVTGGVLGVLAYGKDRDAAELRDQARGTGNLSAGQLDEYNSLRDSRNDLRLAATLSASAGLAVGVTGLVLHAFDEPKVQPPELDQGPQPGGGSGPQDGMGMEVSAAPTWAPGFAGGVFLGRF